MNTRVSKFLVLSFFITLLISGAFRAEAGPAGGISSTDKYAWSDRYGWINFASLHGNIQVTDTEVTGQAWNENTGWITMTPTTTAHVTNDGTGILSGYAWGEGIGYIDFSGVTIDSDGYFHGYAADDKGGRVNFNCNNSSSCGASDFKVRTDWRAMVASTTSSSTPPASTGGDTGTNPAVTASLVGGTFSTVNAQAAGESSSEKRVVPRTKAVAVAAESIPVRDAITGVGSSGGWFSTLLKYIAVAAVLLSFHSSFYQFKKKWRPRSYPDL